MSSFLLEADNKKGLFDKGLNEKLSTAIPDILKELKTNPDEIDNIFITHFHGDHIGRLINSKDEIYYKNAKIYVCKEEYDGWINKMTKDKNELQVKVMKICEKNVIQLNFGDYQVINQKKLLDIKKEIFLLLMI